MSVNDETRKFTVTGRLVGYDELPTLAYAEPQNTDLAEIEIPAEVLSAALRCFRDNYGSLVEGDAATQTVALERILRSAFNEWQRFPD